MAGEARTVAHQAVVLAAERVSTSPQFCTGIERVLDDVSATGVDEVQSALSFVQVLRHSAATSRPGPSPDVLLRVAELATEQHAFALVSYASKHNLANGEENRDGDNQNHSVSCGVEGPTQCS